MSSDWEDQEEQHELEVQLVDFTKTVTWQRIMKPCFLKRQEDISRKLCSGSKLDLESIRELQTIHNYISQILDNPIQFFSQRKAD